MRIIILLLISYGLSAQSYDPWKDAAWYKLRGRFIYEYLEWMKEPCKTKGWWDMRTFVIDKPIVDSIFQEELDSICKIKDSRWVLNDHYTDYAPPYNKMVAGKVRRIVIMTDCPPTSRGPFFIIETNDYKRKKKRKGFLKWLFNPR